MAFRQRGIVKQKTKSEVGCVEGLSEEALATGEESPSEASESPARGVRQLRPHSLSAENLVFIVGIVF